MSLKQNVKPRLSGSPSSVKRIMNDAGVRTAAPAESQFDVFLCYHSSQVDNVAKISRLLRSNHIVPWFDQEQLRPGLPWQRVLESQIRTIKSVAVFIGDDGQGPWQDLEIEAFLRQFVRRGYPVIPVYLPAKSGQIENAGFPVFLEGFQHVDFRRRKPNPLRQLIWGITGTR